MDTRIPRSLPILLICLMSATVVAPALAANRVHNVVFSPGTPAALEFGMDVLIDFEYETDVADARIFFRPFTSGGLTPNFSAHGSNQYSGNGSGIGFFTIVSGTSVVDSVRVQMKDNSNSAVIYEEFFPVRFGFGEYGSVTNIRCYPASPANLQTGQHVDIVFDNYSSLEAGIRIYFVPYSSGLFPPSGWYSPSPLYASGGGIGASSMTVSSGNATVDELRIRIMDADMVTVFQQFGFPVDYSFLPTAVEASTWGRIKSRYR